MPDEVSGIDAVPMKAFVGLLTRPLFCESLIDSLRHPVVFLGCCDAHPSVAVVDCTDLAPPRAPSCFPVM